MSITRKRPTRSKQMAIAGVFVIAMWIPLVFPLPEISLLVIPLILASIFLAITWRSYVFMMPLILNPLILGFGIGIHEWFKDEPRFSSMGLPGNEFFNLDPETRCYRSTGGCIVSGNEWMIQSPQNAGLYLMIKLCGGPRNTYHGPYPSKEEASKLTESASETPLTLFR